MLKRDSVSVCFGRYLPGPGVMSRRFCSGKRSAVVCMRPECACPLRSDSTRVPAKLPSGRYLRGGEGDRQRRAARRAAAAVFEGRGAGGAHLPGPRREVASSRNRGDERLPKPSPARLGCL